MTHRVYEYSLAIPWENKVNYHMIKLYQPWYVAYRRADISIATGVISACMTTGDINLCKICKIIGLT